MENIVINPEGLSLETLRSDVAEAGVRQYGAERRYAIALCEALPEQWFKVEHNDKSESAKPVHAEKEALYKVLKAAKHTNPSTVWARVRKYAFEYKNPKPETAEGETAEGEGESVGARHTRSLDLRLVEDLSTLWKACKRQESLSDKQRQAMTHIGSALVAMGIDLSTIETK